jgi:SRSO17 transposase
MTTEDEQALADWAEHDMTLPARSSTARRGAAAAEHGRAALERASGGRPSIDPAARPGQHSRNRQVRLAADVDQRLRQLAERQKRTTSAVMRDAVADYLSAHAD